MGLEACVYLATPRLPKGFDEASVLRDQVTGEHYTLHPNEDLPRECTVAVQEFIGNVAMVATLREKLLHSGMRYAQLHRILEHSTASGTVFPIEAAARMGEEARELRRERANDKEVVTFCKKVERLVIASQTEQNPVVLV